jgi:hypothetical protein
VHPDRQKSKPLPGEPLACEVCGQDPESLAFDPDQCRGDCPFERSEPAGGDRRV